MSPTDPANPTDTPLGHVLDEMTGDAAGFRSRAGARIECLTCHRDFPADGVDADHLSRLEGASDPDDMVVVVPVVCPHCRAAGALVLPYGADAPADDGDVLRAMHRRPAVATAGPRRGR